MEDMNVLLFPNNFLSKALVHTIQHFENLDALQAIPQTIFRCIFRLTGYLQHQMTLTCQVAPTLSEIADTFDGISMGNQADRCAKR